MPSQLHCLTHDTPEIRRLLEAHGEVLQRLADLTDVDRQARLMVIADLFWQVWYLAMGVQHLLEQELRAPMIPVERALFEAMATLAYLVQHEHSQDEAVIFLAYSYVRDLQAFGWQEDLVRERSVLLARMPQHLVAEATRRATTRPRTWSGRTVKEMAELGKVHGYRELYGFISAESHVSIVGQHVKVRRVGDKAHIVTGRSMDEHEVDSYANFARRALHGSFRILWREFGGPPMEFRSDDPEAWRIGAVNGRGDR